MKLYIKHQESYSQIELLLRTFFGWLYIAIPHGIVLFFLGFASMFITFIAFWAILFTGNYPRSLYEFQVNFFRWNLRVSARLFHLSDGYPAFGLNTREERTDFDMPYPESLNRGILLLKVFFGFFYVIIPHGFILFFRMIATMFLMFLAWFVVLFTGNYPESWHSFNVGTLRWQYRVNVYMFLMTDKYPPFTGKDLEEDSMPSDMPDYSEIPKI